MLHQHLRLIFQRYCAHHMVLIRGGQALIDAAGRKFGQIERIELRQNRLSITGSSHVGRIGISYHDTTLWSSPSTPASGPSGQGFSFDLPFENGDFTLFDEHSTSVMTLKGFDKWDMRKARYRLYFHCFLTLFLLLPYIFAWKIRNNARARVIVKERMGLFPAPLNTHMPDALFDPPRNTKPFEQVNIILPVYNAYELLKECGARVFEHTDIPWHLILVEDCSSDGRIAALLQNWQTQYPERITLLRNHENLGFIASVNRGLRALRGTEAPVILLNSDALVARGWASRLLAPLRRHTVASVTPMSNNAEIYSVPVICQAAPMLPRGVDQLNRAAQALNQDAIESNAPTGVGFCMALSPWYLNKVPYFDPVFGKGYGEETDWCQKTRTLGGQHLCAVNVFVEHRGGTSFGDENKCALLNANGKIISKRYPKYDQEVQDFIRHDPLNSVRLALGLVWAQHQQHEVPVFIGHSMGGGAEKYLAHRIRRETQNGRSAVVLRVGQTPKWRLELHTPYGCTHGATHNFALILRLLEPLTRLRLIYSCGVGVQNADQLPYHLLEITRANGKIHPIEILFHDFFTISPSYTLLDSHGAYQGVPIAGGKNAADAAHQYEISGKILADLGQWQSAWGRVMEQAERCIVFSRSSLEIVQTAYPQTKSKLALTPHQLITPVPRFSPPSKTQRPVIGVLGNIGFHKGAAIVQRLSHDLAKTDAAGLVVLGHIDPAFALAQSAKVHGHYEISDLPYLAARYDISGWLIPSIWPETFSFTTHEALSSGLPVLTFDLGAQAEAVKQAGLLGAKGAVLPLPSSKGLDVDDLLMALAHPLSYRSAG